MCRSHILFAGSKDITIADVGLVGGENASLGEMMQTLVPQGIRIPLFFSSYGLGVAAIGLLKAIYPVVWGVTQVFFGPLSNRWGRKWLIVGGMIVRAFGIWLTVLIPTGVHRWDTGRFPAAAHAVA